jgi:hypothetical protein
LPLPIANRKGNTTTEHVVDAGALAGESRLNQFFFAKSLFAGNLLSFI